MATATAVFSTTAKGRIKTRPMVTLGMARVIYGTITISGGNYATGGLPIVDANGDSLLDHLGTMNVFVGRGLTTVGDCYSYNTTTNLLLCYTGASTEHGVSAIADTVTFIAIGK